MTGKLEQLRPNWRRNWLESIQDYADIQTQRQRWLDPNETNLHYQYVEYICWYDWLRLKEMGGYEGAVRAGLMTRQEADAVAKFHDLADHYKSPNGDYDQTAILSDPKWAAVVEAAQWAQSALLVLLDEPSEIVALTKGTPS